MPDVKEVFEEVTRTSRPQPGSLQRQHARQDSHTRRRRIGTIAVAALLLGIVGGAFALTQASNEHTGPAHTSPAPAPPPARTSAPSIVGLDGTVQRELIGLPADANSLNVSPDGHTIVFVAEHDGSTQVGTIGIGGKGLRFITNLTSVVLPGTGQHGPLTPVWSPDGRQIAFANGQIYLMNPDGSGLRQLTDQEGYSQWPDWSPDGSTIAYSNSGSSSLDSSGFSLTQQIWTIPSAGGTPTRLTDTQASHDMPAYSPKGDRIAFFLDANSRLDGSIELMALDGSDRRTIVSGRPHAVFNPRWSPDGTRLAYLQCCTRLRSSNDLPVLTVHVIDVQSGTANTTVPAAKVESDVNAVQWTSNHTLIINRYVG